MEKRRIRLEINGVVCGLITEESEEYMQALAKEVGEMMKQVLDASPFVTREAAALTAALSYCDDLKKTEKRAEELREKAEELELEAEIWQEEKAEMEKAAPAADGGTGEKLRELEEQAEDLRRRAARLEERNTELESAAAGAREWEEKALRLEDENAALREAVSAVPEAPAVPVPAQEPPVRAERPASGRRNPLRQEYEQEGFVSFFEKK